MYDIHYTKYGTKVFFFILVSGQRDTLFKYGTYGIPRLLT
jgi:hypothetical protein